MVKELPLASAPSSAANGGAGGAMVINRGSEECRGNTGSTHTNIAVLVADLNDQTIYTELQKNDVLLGRGKCPTAGSQEQERLLLLLHTVVEMMVTTTSMRVLVLHDVPWQLSCWCCRLPTSDSHALFAS